MRRWTFLPLCAAVSVAAGCGSSTPPSGGAPSGGRYDVTITRTSSSRLIQLHHWSPLPSRPPTPSLNGGSVFFSAPPSADCTMPVRSRRGEMPGIGRVADERLVLDL